MRERTEICKGTGNGYEKGGTSTEKPKQSKESRRTLEFSDVFGFVTIKTEPSVGVGGGRLNGLY